MSIVPLPTYQEDIISLVVGGVFTLSISTLIESIYRAAHRGFWIDHVQWFSSLCQTTVNLMFILQILYIGFECKSLVYAPIVLLYTSWIASTSILIYQSTINLNFEQRRIARGLMAFLLVICIGFVTYSAVSQPVVPLDNGYCSFPFDRISNNVGKSFLCVVFITASILFSWPMLVTIKKMQRQGVSTYAVSTNGNHQAKVSNIHQRVLDVLANVMVRLLFAITIFIVTTILSLTGAFGAFYYIEFALQNYSAVVASNLCSSWHGTDKPQNEGQASIYSNSQMALRAQKSHNNL